MLVKKNLPSIYSKLLTLKMKNEIYILSKVKIKYRKVLECCKDIENDFCLNNFLNNNLDTEFESLF